jgi:hypothetical protein
MPKETKIITPDQHLKGLALFTMAAEHYAKAHEFESALADLLGVEDGPYCGCISDEMVDGGNYARGLEREGYKVKAPAEKKR